MHCFVRHRLCPAAGSLTRTVCRSKHHKTPAERLPAFVRYERAEIPLKDESSSYSDEDKLRLWSQVKPSDLRPPYFAFTKEERARLGLQEMEQVAYVPGIPRPALSTVNPEEQPFNEIYADAVNSDTFTDTRNLLQDQPDRWYWVERLMPSAIHPRQTRAQTEPIQSTDGGFVAPPSKSPSLPYFVPRTRNNLLPVYKVVEYKDQKAKTVVRNVTGDLWTLERVLRSILEPLQAERLLSAVNEVTGEIRFMGSYERQVSDHLIKLGF
jgi:hypothetical protein